MHDRPSRRESSAWVRQEIRSAVELAQAVLPALPAFKSRDELGLSAGLEPLNLNLLDAIAGIPVLDIKPYMAEFGPRGELHQPGWATQIMRDYY